MEGLFHLELKLQPETGERRGSINSIGACNGVAGQEEQQRSNPICAEEPGAASLNQIQKTVTKTETNPPSTLTNGEVLSHNQQNEMMKGFRENKEFSTGVGVSSSHPARAMNGAGTDPNPGSNEKVQPKNVSNGIQASYRR